MNKASKALVVGAAVLFAGWIAFGIYTLQPARSLNRDLGFQHGSPYFTFGNESFEVFTLHPRPGGVMSAAGVRDSDIVLSHSVTGFYRALHEHRGSTITFRVTGGGDGVPIAQRPIRTMTLQIPTQRQNK